MTDMPQGTAIAPGAPGGTGGTPDEILVAFAEPAPQNRLTVLVRIILAIPHLVVLYALGIAAEVVVIICWFAALFLGRLPEGLAGYLSGYMRWLIRVQAYLFLLTDRYPPFELGEADYPVQILLRPGPLNRLAVLFRIILAIPASVLATLVVLGMETIVMFVTWLIVLIAGQMPRPLYEAIAAGQRYYFRYTGYLFLLTGTYPWGLFGDQPDLAAAPPRRAAGPPAGFGRLARVRPARSWVRAACRVRPARAARGYRAACRVRPARSRVCRARLRPGRCRGPAMASRVGLRPARGGTGGWAATSPGGWCCPAGPRAWLACSWPSACSSSCSTRC